MIATRRQPPIAAAFFRWLPSALGFDGDVANCAEAFRCGLKSARPILLDPFSSCRDRDKHGPYDGEIVSDRAFVAESIWK
jgi:hypothetical protein